LEDSQLSIDRLAADLKLLVRDAKDLKQDFKGDVVVATDHHVLLRISDLVAVRFEKASLDQPVELGDKVLLRYSTDRTNVMEPSKEPLREASREIERDFAHDSR